LIFEKEDDSLCGVTEILYRKLKIKGTNTGVEKKRLHTNNICTCCFPQ